MGRELRMVPPGWEHPKNDGDMIGIYGINVYEDGCEEHPV